MMTAVVASFLGCVLGWYGNKAWRYFNRSFVCTHCGWVGKRKDLKPWSLRVKNGCPKCDYMAMDTAHGLKWWQI